MRRFRFPYLSGPREDPSFELTFTSLKMSAREESSSIVMGKEGESLWDFTCRLDKERKLRLNKVHFVAKFISGHEKRIDPHQDLYILLCRYRVAINIFNDGLLEYQISPTKPPDIKLVEKEETIVLVGEKENLVRVEEKPLPIEPIFASSNIEICFWQKNIPVIAQEALSAVHMHVGEDTARERGGILLGKPYHSSAFNCHWTHIERAFPVFSTNNSAIHIGFAAEHMAHAIGQAAQQYPDLVLVGWYHSHPNLGSHFVSNIDSDTHRNYYPEPWHIAMVIDPCASRNVQVNFFFSDTKRTVVRAGLWFIDNGTMSNERRPE